MKWEAGGNTFVTKGRGERGRKGEKKDGAPTKRHVKDDKNKKLDS